MTDSQSAHTQAAEKAQPIRCAARCSQYPNCQHDWTAWEEHAAARAEVVTPPASEGGQS